ncbi:MAG: helix-turn-helix domain-containing protein [Clostridia bacterium]
MKRSDRDRWAQDFHWTAIPEALPAVLQGYRYLFGLDRTMLADRSGVRGIFVAAFEHGRRAPTPEELWRLSGPIGEEEEPNLARWQVLLAAAFLSDPGPELFAPVAARDADPESHWRAASRAEALFASAADAADRIDRAARELLDAYVDDGRRYWPRFGQASLPHWHRFAHRTAWFEVAWFSDGSGQNALDRALARFSDLPEPDTQEWVELAGALWEVWTRRGRNVPSNTRDLRPDPDRLERLERYWAELSVPNRTVLLGLARALLGQ